MVIITECSLESSSANSLTVSAIPGAEYSIDGGTTWQTSNTFSGLDAGKSYTILVRMAEDENHTASGTRPVTGKTTDTPVNILDTDMPSYSTVYNGNRQPYPYTSLLTDMEGIRSVSIMYVGTLASGKPYETSEAPVDAGTYKVRFYLVAEDTYDLSAEQVYADMTISKAPQTMPAAPTIARRTTTTIALNPVPGAEYSVDGGATWQDSQAECVQTDNGFEFTNRFSNSKRNILTLFEKTAAELGNPHKLIRPYTPRHNGKVERSHREDQKRFCSIRSFFSRSDFEKQLTLHNHRSNHLPMRNRRSVISIGFFSSLFRSWDVPQNRTAGSGYTFYFGGSTSGKAVTERSAMQMTAVYSCVRILAEAVAGLPLNLYRYTEDGGKEKAIGHPLYLLLHDEPNPEMSSFVFRETLIPHLLL